MTAEDRRPFRINVADSELAELRERLDRVRWAPEPPDGDGGYGEPARAGVQDLVERSGDRYDWRVWEATAQPVLAVHDRGRRHECAFPARALAGT